MTKLWALIFLLSGTTVSGLYAQKKFHTCHEVTVDEFHAWFQSIPLIIIFDIREDSAFKMNHIPKAISVTSDSLLMRISDTLDVDQKIIVYDQYGNESIDACLLLASRGKSSVYHLKGGLLEWGKLNYTTEKFEPKKR